MNTREETYHMTDKEMARLIVAERLIEGEITIKGAAEVLKLSTRQVKRIKKGVRLIGPKAVIHGNRKRKPINAVDKKVKDLVVELKTKKYGGTNFSHFTELLSEREDIIISQPTVHRILASAGIASPRKKKKIRTHRYRKRKDCPGMMVQLDASPYPWLGGEELNLHGAIDDASSNISGLYLCREETLEGYFEVTRQMIGGPGIPISTYSDRRTIFFSPTGKLTLEDQLEGKTEPYTQFSAAMEELGINMIPAGSPQAKGRIERLWGTLQDRLVQEFILNGIKDIESANKFMATYIKKFNRRFSVVPRGESVFRKPGKGTRLDHVLCRKIPRKLDGGSAFSYMGKYYQLLSGGKPAATIPRSKIIVLTSSRIGIKARYSGKVYSVARLEERPKTEGYVKVVKDKRTLPTKHANIHPWKKTRSNGFRYDSRDEELALGLFNSTIAWETDNY
ncbi:MAG TPA: ISNCY family transposase [Desulfatiglandales bacterium]|nr:ISNCY family transposase [Desulfatiglandales bacterium]